MGEPVLALVNMAANTWKRAKVARRLGENDEKPGYFQVRPVCAMRLVACERMDWRLMGAQLGVTTHRMLSL